MARNKEHEAIVFVLDVGPSMSEIVAGETDSYFEQSLKCIQWILQRKLFTASKDKLALVLCGTPTTSNQLATDLDDQYQNITEARSLTLVQWNYLSFVREKVQLSSVSADFVDALVVALNVLANEADGKDVSLRKIVFFSNFGGDFSSDQLDTIVKGINKLKVELNVIGPDLDDINCNSGKNSQRQEQAQTLMKTILERTSGEFYTFADAIPQLMFYQTKEVRSVPWNVNLDIGPDLQIPVSAFIKIREVRPKPFKSCYARDEQTRLTTETSYHKNDEAQTEVNLDDVVKAFRYGSTLVPFSEEDKENMKYKGSEKCLSVLGFTKRDNVKVHHYSGLGSRLVVGRKNDEMASVALSALIHALYEMNSVAIVRYCYSASSGPKMGFLAPLIKSNHEALILILLPYMEDIRRFVFAPLTSKASQKASDSQLEAIDDFITKMTLISDDDIKEEQLQSSTILNPNVQRAYQCISHRAMDENSLLPEIEPQFMRKLIPAEELVNAAKSAIGLIKDLFPLKLVEKKKKRAATDLFENNENAKKEDEEDADLSPTKKPRLYDALQDGIAGLVQGPVTSIGTVTPVENFKLLIKHSGASPERVCKEMQNVIVQIVSESFGRQFYSKALECLKALRTESSSDAVNQFNEFLKEVKNTLAKERKEFWQMIRQENISLIDKNENSLSDVSAAEAKLFLEGEEEITEPAGEEMEDDADDLLAMM